MPCLEAPRGSIWCCLVLASKNVCLGLASALPRRFCLGLVLASNLLPRPCLVHNLNITRTCGTTGINLLCACYFGTGRKNFQPWWFVRASSPTMFAHSDHLLCPMVFVKCNDKLVYSRSDYVYCTIVSIGNISCG